MNIADNDADERWINWKNQFISDNQSGKAITFVIIYDRKPISEGTLIFSPECRAINGRTPLADNKNVANINALQIRKEHEGKRYISALIRMIEQYAANNGYRRLTIGVEARETRNLEYIYIGDIISM